MRWSRPELARFTALLVALAIVGSGCAAVSDLVSPEAAPDRAVVQGVPLDLAFGDAPPGTTTETPPTVVVPDEGPPLGPDRAVEGGFADLGTGDDVPAAPTRRPADGTVADECPEPGPSAVAERPITGDVTAAVAPGAYTYRQTGSIEYVGLTKVPPPRVGRRTVGNVRNEGGATLFDVDGVVGRRREVREMRVVPGDGVFLTGVRTIVDGQERRFRPATPVEILPLPVAEQATVNGAGVDPATGEALVVQGQVVRKERVLGCGEVIDGWLVEASWTYRQGSQVRPYDEDYVVAPQHGGLVIADHVVATETYGNLVIRLDLTSALGSIHPRPT